MDFADLSPAQRAARYALIVFLVALGVWMLWRFVPALCWAVVLAIATSTLYDRWSAQFRGKHRRAWAAATFTILMGVVLIAPLIYAGALAVSEAISLARSLIDAARNGPPAPPDWIVAIPWAGDWFRAGWNDLFPNGGFAMGAFSHARPTLIEWTRLVGVQVMRRVVTLVFTLLTLFFVYLYRDELRDDAVRASHRLFGSSVDRLLVRAVAAIRATVDGIVLVAVAEGAIMGVVYALAGVSHPVLLGAVTGAFAMIPFAAPIVFGMVALVLGLEGAFGAAVSVAAVGIAMLFIADHFVRPAIIGGAARLPFLWVLLGLLGGVESFGLLGIFLGPALMAALVAIWRGWVTETSQAGR
ncbi:MAG TPA: AI-2E family transporter [Steroidobacteraceae bacterium]|nr:AI-2E family transporter [Steroidobacteraceae bacterium]